MSITPTFHPSLYHLSRKEKKKITVLELKSADQTTTTAIQVLYQGPDVRDGTVCFCIDCVEHFYGAATDGRCIPLGVGAETLAPVLIDLEKNSFPNKKSPFRSAKSHYPNINLGTSLCPVFHARGPYTQHSLAYFCHILSRQKPDNDGCREKERENTLLQFQL